MSLKFSPETVTSCTLSGVFSNDKTSGFTVSYSVKNFGFGSIELKVKDGKLICDSETCSREFVTFILGELVKRAEFTDLSDEDNPPVIAEKENHLSMHEDWEDVMVSMDTLELTRCDLLKSCQKQPIEQISLSSIDEYYVNTVCGENPKDFKRIVFTDDDGKIRILKDESFAKIEGS